MFIWALEDSNSKPGILSDYDHLKSLNAEKAASHAEATDDDTGGEDMEVGGEENSHDITTTNFKPYGRKGSKRRHLKHGSDYCNSGRSY